MHECKPLDGAATVCTTLPAVGVAARHWLTPAPHQMLRRVSLDIQLGGPGRGLLRTSTRLSLNFLLLSLLLRASVWAFALKVTHAGTSDVGSSAY